MFQLPHLGVAVDVHRMAVVLFELCEHLQLALLLPEFVTGLDLGRTTPADPTCIMLLTLCRRVVRLLLESH